MPGTDSKYLEHYEAFIESLPTKIHMCRVRGHKFPDWDDNRHVKITRQRTGSYLLTGECLRKCGTVQYSYVDSSGYLERRTQTKLDYSANRDNYLLPANARSGRGLTRDMRAIARVILLDKLSEWITEE